MSRKPDNPEKSNRETDDIDAFARPAGTRYVSRESEVWALEQEMAAEGRLPEDASRAVPLSEHPELGDDLTAEEIRKRIERESETPVPNKSRIGHLNDLLGGVVDDE